jgi:hypothetical protein
MHNNILRHCRLTFDYVIFAVINSWAVQWISTVVELPNDLIRHLSDGGDCHLIVVAWHTMRWRGCHRIIINPARGCYVVIWMRCTDSKWRNNATTASDSAAGAMASLGWPMVLVVVRRRGVSTAVTSGDKPSLRLDRRVYIMARGERGCWSDIFLMSKDNTIWNLVSRVMKCRSYWSHSFDTTF